MAEEKKQEMTSFTDLLKNIGLIASGLGSLAILFLWIGYAIISARLREYHLYGLIHYTDEYVRDAGYQFFNDIFTFFFSSPATMLLFLIASILVISLIPIGPFGSPENRRKKGQSTGLLRKMGHYPVWAYSWLKGYRVHYGLFLLLAVSVSISLTPTGSGQRLIRDIEYQVGVLNQALELMQQQPLLFEVKDIDIRQLNAFQQRYYSEFALLVPRSGWNPLLLKDALAKFGYDTGGQAPLQEAVARFQSDFDIREKPEFAFNGDFERSVTYRVLSKLLFSQHIREKLFNSVMDAKGSWQELIGNYLVGDEVVSEEDFSNLLTLIPAKYQQTNKSLNKLKLLRKNILTFFAPGNEETEKLMQAILPQIEPFRFGTLQHSYSFRLSCAFWVLLSLLVYLIVNAPKVLAFGPWEKGYYGLILFLFGVIAILLPNTYGRYVYEFNIKKVTDVRFAADTKSDADHPVRKKIEELRKSNANMYILGPTKGKEIMIGAIPIQPDSRGTKPQIFLMEEGMLKFMVLEFANPEEIPTVVKMLKQK